MRFLKFVLYTAAVFIFLLIRQPVKADILPDTVYAVTPAELSFQSIKPGSKLELYVYKTGVISGDLNLQYGDKIEVLIKKYIKPKRGRRNGYFEIAYADGKLMSGTMRMSEPKDAAELAAQAGLAAAGFALHIPGLAQAAAAAKGLILPNENQTRLQSAGHNIYESTPIKYKDKGSDFEVPENGFVVIRLKD